MTLPPDPFDGNDSAAGHGGLATLAHRGAERGAATVLDGARHDARRHRRRRVGAGSLACVVVAGLVGGLVVLRDDDRAPVTAGDPPPEDPEPQPRVVTDVRISRHDGIDRVEIDFVGEPLPPEVGEPPPTLWYELPQCRKPDYDPVTNLGWGVRTDVAATPDGLPPELSGRRFTGDGAFVREVVPLCAVDGRMALGIAFVEPFLMQRDGGDFTGELSFRRCTDGDDHDTEVIDFFLWTDPEGRTPPPGVCG